MKVFLSGLFILVLTLVSLGCGISAQNKVPFRGAYLNLLSSEGAELVFSYVYFDEEQYNVRVNVKMVHISLDESLPGTALTVRPSAVTRVLGDFDGFGTYTAKEVIVFVQTQEEANYWGQWLLKQDKEAEKYSEELKRRKQYKKVMPY